LHLSSHIVAGESLIYSISLSTISSIMLIL